MANIREKTPEFQNFISWANTQLDQSKSGYEKAIQYYTILKNTFIKDMLQIQQESVDEQAKIFIKDINDKLVSGQEDELFTKQHLNELYQELEKYVDVIINNSIGQGNETVQTAIKKVSTTQYERGNKKIEYSSNLKSTLKRLKTELSIIPNSMVSLQEDLNEIFIKIFGTGMSVQSHFDGTMGLLKRAILNKLTDGKYINEILSSERISGYRSYFRGYYSEEAKTTVLNEGKKLLTQGWGAAQTGLLPGANGQLSSYDVIIGRGINKNTSSNVLQSFLKSMDYYDQELHTDVEIELLNPANLPRDAYGIQSKLWFMPEENATIKNWYKVGDRNELLNSIGGGILTRNFYTWFRGWHYNIYLLSNYITTALGQSQVMYGLQKFIWTADLIFQMRKAGYWLSFYYSRENGKFKYPIQTGELIWDLPQYQYANHMRKRNALRKRKI